MTFATVMLEMLLVIEIAGAIALGGFVMFRNLIIAAAIIAIIAFIAKKRNSKTTSP